MWVDWGKDRLEPHTTAWNEVSPAAASARMRIVTILSPRQFLVRLPFRIWKSMWAEHIHIWSEKIYCALEKIVNEGNRNESRHHITHALAVNTHYCLCYTFIYTRIEAYDDLAIKVNDLGSLRRAIELKRICKSAFRFIFGRRICLKNSNFAIEELKISFAH